MRSGRTPVDGFEVTWTDGARPDDSARWLPAVVPGGVHESLLAAGVIEHPYYGCNEHDLAWVDDATWWYRTRFTAEPGLLRFDGLDTVADVELDGAVVGTARNQHRSHTFPLGTAGEHELLLRFPPPLDDLLDEDELAEQAETVHARQRRVRPHDPPTPQDEVELRLRRVQLRKATFSWGWDFAPRVTSRGISGPVSVLHESPLLTDVRVRSADVDVVARTASLEVSGTVPDGAVVRVDVTAPDGTVRSTTTTGDGGFRVDLPMADVRLWWTHDLGSPDLYGVRVTAVRDDVQVEAVELRHGVRTLVLDRSPDPEEDARLFRFVLNGQPLFARGANWVPESMLVSSVDRGATRDLVRLARDGGMTMLRVWGGGVYPSDAFYDACDELGVLVWQDFMFACYDYPDPHGRLARETELEAIEQVRRLRHHASLALWCGENEVQAIHELVTGDASPGDWGWSLFNELLPTVVATHDPDTPYWPGSPWGDLPGELLNGTRDGDRHAWEVWHGSLDIGAGGPTSYATPGEAMHFSRFDHDLGRFVSEFGIHASPELATLQRWTPPGSLALGSPQLEHRIKDTPKDKGYALLEHETGLPTTVEEYVDVSMACQAEGLKHGVEHYRRRQPHCSGTLVWQLNDSWPGLSWSVVDVDHVPKAGYWFLQRAYRPLLASFRVTGDVLELWVTSSGRDAVELDLTVEVGTLTGPVDERVELAVTAEPCTSRPVWSGALPGPDAVAWVAERTGRLPANRRFFAPLRSLPLREASVTAVVEESGPSSARIRLTAQGYGYLSRVLSDRPGPRFSTNYVDLRDGTSCVIDVTDIPEGAALSVSSYGAQPRPIAR